MIRVENIRRMEATRGASRFLIDRQWPAQVVRSIPHKEMSGQARRPLAQIHWSPELAPSAALWKWFHHEPDRIDRFRSRYFDELRRKKKSWVALAQEAQKNEVALLYHGTRADLAPAYFLKEFLDAQLETHRVPEPERKRTMGLPGRGVAVPVDKAISRKHSQPLKNEKPLRPGQKLTFVSAEKRRMVR